VHFRETITRSAQGQGRYKKQTGGRGQFGDVWIKLEPAARGEGFEFINKIVGGVVPGKFIPAVEKGIVEALRKGVVAGYPVVDFKATLFDGSHHAVDSSEMAFKVAGSMAFKKVMEEAGAILLEPILEVTVLVPDDHTGDVMGDLSSRRGRILGMTPAGRMQEVRAYVPEIEMYHYGAQLRSLSQGRARFQASFHAYEEIPRDTAERIIAAARAALEESQEG
jgi:elongation factor G